LRYGIVRQSPRLPPAAFQRRAVELAQCDVILEEVRPSRQGQRRLLRFLETLRAGDELVLHNLEALEFSTGQIVRMLHRFFEAGVSVRFTADPAGDILTPGPMPKVLALLAEHEFRQPDQVGKRRSREGMKPLSRYQIEYARKMLHEGASARTVGLLFQLPPDDILTLVGE